MYFTAIWIFAQTTTNSSFNFSPPWFWFIIGIGLCFTEFFLAKNLPNQFKKIALFLGISAFITAISVWQMAVAMEVDWSLTNNYDEDFHIQIVYWMGVSLASIIWVRPGLSKRKKFIIPDATEAQTITEFFPGKSGKVLYEGCYWQACCIDKQMAIAPNQKVFVLRRQGNTLIISSHK